MVLLQKISERLDEKWRLEFSLRDSDMEKSRWYLFQVILLRTVEFS